MLQIKRTSEYCVQLGLYVFLSYIVMIVIWQKHNVLAAHIHQVIRKEIQFQLHIFVQVCMCEKLLSSIENNIHI